MRILSSLVLLTVTCAALPSAAWAGWACGARGDDGSLVRWWGSSTAEEASRNVLDSCAKSRIHCEIISCKPGVDDQETAHQVWPQAGPVTQCFGGGPCETGQRKY
jgi:hypothetical protein